MNDTEIVEGIRDGHRAAGEELLVRFEAPLVRYLRAAMPTPDVAEDAAQEVFLRLIASIKAGRTHDVRSLTALVFTIARRLAIDAGRANSRKPRVLSLEMPLSAADGAGTLGDTVPDRGEDPREAAARRERDRHVQEALRGLDEETRSVITLRHVDGLSTREVAEVLGVAEGTVWSRLHRGLEALRQKLSARPISSNSPSPRTRRP